VIFKFKWQILKEESKWVLLIGYQKFILQKLAGLAYLKLSNLVFFGKKRQKLENYHYFKFFPHSLAIYPGDPHAVSY
jgi:hypothetical protein